MKSAKLRRFSTYKALECALRRGKYSRPGVLATHLLETFLEKNGEFRSDVLVADGACKPGQFTSLRRKLIRDGWVIWSEHQTYKARYFAGKKMIKYINTEKTTSCEVATMEDLSSLATKTEVVALQKRVHKLEQVIENGITQYLADNPPDNASRRAKVRKTFEERGKLELQ